MLGGIFLTTKVLERLMSRHPQPTYLIILGFMFGSLPELFPGIPAGVDLAAGLAAGAAGFGALYVMSMKEQNAVAGDGWGADHLGADRDDGGLVVQAGSDRRPADRRHCRL